jgi:hypothetical protein
VAPFLTPLTSTFHLPLPLSFPQIRLVGQVTNREVIINTRSYISFTLISTDAAAEYRDYVTSIKATMSFKPYLTHYNFRGASRS